MVPGDAPANGTKPAGPAISGVAKQIALADGKSATVFTPTVAVDGGVVLAVPKEQWGAPSSRFYGFKFTTKISLPHVPPRKVIPRTSDRDVRRTSPKTHCRNFRLVSGH
jgi:hypothetical protein